MKRMLSVLLVLMLLTVQGSAAAMLNMKKFQEDLAKQQQNAKNYSTLCRGDNNDDVKKMQNKLISLGYLGDKADGKFGANTEQAVKDFQTQNGLSVTGVAYSETLKLLYSDDAKRFVEPSVTLIVPSDGYGQWKNYSGNKLGFRAKVKNISKTKTIKAFELYCYAVDVYGDYVYGEDQVYYHTTTKKVKPGETVYSEYSVLPYRNEIYNVYCGIKRVVYSDGTSAENASVDYMYWTIK